MDETVAASEARRRVPLSVAAYDLACLAFAGWTVVCNAVVFSGGTTLTLLWALAVALVIALAAAWRGRAWLAHAMTDVAEAPAAPTPPAFRPALRVLAVVAGLGIAFAYRSTGSVTLLSKLASAYLLVAWLLVVRTPSTSPRSAGRGWREVVLWGLAFSCGALTLAAHRPDADDAFYVHMAVSVTDFPRQALLAHDTMHGIPDRPLGNPIYRVHSLELLSGLISYLTGVQTLRVCHWVMPTIAAFLTPFALARLLRLLDPARWLWAVVAVLAVLVSDASTHRSFGNFAFVRMFQGKAMLLTALMPVIAAYGIRFALRPSLGRWLLLCASQIAAIGLSVTGLWLAPVFATFAVAVPLRLARASLRTLASGVLASFYPIAVGLYFKFVVLAKSATPAATATASVARTVQAQATPDWLAQALGLVLGKPGMASGWLAAALIAWPLCRTPLARRFAIVMPLGFFVFAFNPWTSDFVAHQITSPAIHWRVLWLVPLPVLVALCCVSPIGPGSIARRALGGVIAAALLAAFIAHVAETTRLRQLHLRWPPGPKVPPGPYAVATALVATVRPGSHVLAPSSVSLVVPMLNGRRYAVLVKDSYLKKNSADLDRRRKLRVLLSRKPLRQGELAWFVANLARYRVTGIALRMHAHDTVLPLVLRREGFRVVGRMNRYQIWKKSPQRVHRAPAVKQRAPPAMPSLPRDLGGASAPRP